MDASLQLRAIPSQWQQRQGRPRQLTSNGCPLPRLARRSLRPLVSASAQIPSTTLTAHNAATAVGCTVLKHDDPNRSAAGIPAGRPHAYVAVTGRQPKRLATAIGAMGPRTASSASHNVRTSKGNCDVGERQGGRDSSSGSGNRDGMPYSGEGGMDNSTLTSMDWNDWIDSASASDSSDGYLLAGNGSRDEPRERDSVAAVASGNGAKKEASAGAASAGTSAAGGGAASATPAATVRIAVHAVAASFDRRQLEAALKAAYGSAAVRKYPDVIHCQLARGRDCQPGADAFFFDSGVVALWGLTQDTEAELVQKYAVQFAVQPLPPRDRERDVFRCTFAADPAAAAPAAPTAPTAAAAAKSLPLREIDADGGGGAASSSGGTVSGRRYPRRPMERAASPGVAGAGGAAAFPLPSQPAAAARTSEPAAREPAAAAYGPFSLLSFPPQIADDTVLLHVRHCGDTATLLAVSYGLAQSTKLSAFEKAVDAMVGETRGLPEALAEAGEVHLSGREIGRLIGKVFVLKRSVNLFGSVADTPEFFWYAPDHLQALYGAITRYVELSARLEQLNGRFDMLQELLELLRAQEEYRHGTRLELVVIWLIVVEVVLGVFELLDLFGVIGPGTGFGG